ncbi:hypothetical protein [Roseomonas genomospecies 6]|uniref:Uncharacterized protein n=1 Tax=Roseomonas genomospecies 6 TaxID=214106 RepID=A0A9W7NIB2_9PROT|nr:hypothetical protein [Roseomonas genomospecies 6]KAA0679479.1 hypothetical protein DS843_16190 [Roseomonas genomospecies 6]
MASSFYSATAKFVRSLSVSRPVRGFMPPDGTRISSASSTPSKKLNAYGLSPEDDQIARNGAKKIMAEWLAGHE